MVKFFRITPFISPDSRKIAGVKKLDGSAPGRYEAKAAIAGVKLQTERIPGMNQDSSQRRKTHLSPIAAETTGNGRQGRIRAQNRNRILDAAERVFAEKGFDGATTSQIARQAGLPKANVHYYFGTKEAIYLAVLENIINLWLEAIGGVTEQDDPAEALERYIREKMALTRARPLASRIFANEIIRGAPVLKPYLETELKNWVERKARVLKSWSDAGKMDPVSPEHLIFMIWAATQTYADFAVQIQAVLGKDALDEQSFEEATRTITHIVLKGCGITR